MLQFRSNLFLGTTRLYLTQLNDPAHDNLFSKLSGIIVPLGCLFVTFVGWLINKYGFAISGHTVNWLGLVRAHVHLRTCRHILEESPSLLACNLRCVQV